MPVLLVATDFSAAGDNAAFYAASLAQEWGYSLTLLHAYFVPVTFNDPAMPIIPVDELRDVNLGRMDKAAAALRQSFPDLQLDTRTEYGDIQDILEELIDEMRPALMVIGSHSEDQDSFWAGDTAASLLRSSKTPILAVPEGYAYQPVASICMAVDAAGIRQDDAYEALQSLLRQTAATLHVLHVAPSEQAAQAADVSIPPLEGIATQMHLISAEANQVDEAIAGFIAANAVSWLAVIPHHYSFWESLFHKSHTKALVHKSAVPVLALH